MCATIYGLPKYIWNWIWCLCEWLILDISYYFCPPDIRRKRVHHDHTLWPVHSDSWRENACTINHGQRFLVAVLEQLTIKTLWSRTKMICLCIFSPWVATKQVTTDECNGQIYSSVNCEGIVRCVFVYNDDVDTYIHTCSHQINQYTCIPLEFGVHYNLKINPFESWGGGGGNCTKIWGSQIGDGKGVDTYSSYH